MAEFINQCIINKENLKNNLNEPIWKKIRRDANIFGTIVTECLDTNHLGNLQPLNLLEPELFFLNSYSVAIIVNISFSVELALKAILEFQGNFTKKAHTHKFDILFDLLNDTTKQLILEDINTTMIFEKIKTISELSNRLKSINTLFEKFRYFFDGKFNWKDLEENFLILYYMFHFLLNHINNNLE